MLFRSISLMGDAFNDYILIQYGFGAQGSFLRGIPQTRFGSYRIGILLDIELSEQQINDLLNGQRIDFSYFQEQIKPLTDYQRRELTLHNSRDDFMVK